MMKWRNTSKTLPPMENGSSKTVWTCREDQDGTQNIATDQLVINPDTKAITWASGHHLTVITDWAPLFLPPKRETVEEPVVTD